MTDLAASEGLALVVVFLLLIGYYAGERRRHERNLRRIPLRIHVNGTRGKSSVTRLIAAGLRAGGLAVLAKTTGSEAKVIYPDGSEQRQPRRGPANIRELVAFVALAAADGAGAIVVECMAIRPDLQHFSEDKLIRAHIGVITNIRPDHEEVMGAGLVNVASALGNTVPAAGTLVTTPAAYELLAAAGAAGPERTLVVGPDSTKRECLEDFGFEVFVENLALALAVCELAGVDRETALAGMRAAQPDLGNVTVQAVAAGGRAGTFVNGLAANDPESTRLLWHRYVTDGSQEIVIVLNCRPDRKYRTAQLAAALSAVHHGLYLVSGDGAFAKCQLIRQGVAGQSIRLIDYPHRFEDLFAAAGTGPGERVTFFAAGNVQGFQHLPIWRPGGADQQCTSCS